MSEFFLISLRVQTTNTTHISWVARSTTTAGVSDRRTECETVLCENKRTICRYGGYYTVGCLRPPPTQTKCQCVNNGNTNSFKQIQLRSYSLLRVQEKEWTRVAFGIYMFVLLFRLFHCNGIIVPADKNKKRVQCVELQWCGGAQYLYISIPLNW